MMKDRVDRIGNLVANLRHLNAGLVLMIAFASRTSPGFITAGLRTWSGFAIMADGDGDMALFVPLFDIAMGLGRLVQRKSFIDDGFYLSRFNELLDLE
jgi:hypothetical protein